MKHQMLFTIVLLAALPFAAAHGEETNDDQEAKPKVVRAMPAKPADPAKPQRVNGAEKPQPVAKGLLLPAVQKARDGSARAEPGKTSQLGKRPPSAEDFDRMLKMRMAHVHKASAPSSPVAGTQVKAKPGVSKYEVADCGTDTKPIVCCSYGGQNSTCNMFMSLCTQHGGTPVGDSNEATCSF